MTTVRRTVYGLYTDHFILIHLKNTRKHLDLVPFEQQQNQYQHQNDRDTKLKTSCLNSIIGQNPLFLKWDFNIIIIIIIIRIDIHPIDVLH